MNIYLVVLAIVSVTSAATITNNNFARPGESITNNNDASGDEVIVNNNIKGQKFRFHSRQGTRINSHVFEEEDCPFGTITNNNQGSKEVICLPRGVPSSINNNN